MKPTEPPVYADISLQDIIQIQPLWEKLNTLHYQDSIYFKDHYANFTFEKRVELIHRMPAEQVKITLVMQNGAALGYCLSTVADGSGEVDSLYVDEALRGQGVGKRLVEEHVAWLKEKGCDKIRLVVSYGHESVLDFYHACGFFERLTVLEYKAGRD